MVEDKDWHALNGPSHDLSRIEQIAKVCHEANRAYCENLGDCSQEPWDKAELWQKRSAIDGVEFVLANPSAPASASHDNWLKLKRSEGWSYGPVKDPEKRLHPCCVPYQQLPKEQQRKDALFKAIVLMLSIPI